MRGRLQHSEPGHLPRAWVPLGQVNTLLSAQALPGGTVHVTGGSEKKGGGGCSWGLEPGGEDLPLMSPTPRPMPNMPSTAMMPPITPHILLAVSRTQQQKWQPALGCPLAPAERHTSNAYLQLMMIDVHVLCPHGIASRVRRAACAEVAGGHEKAGLRPALKQHVA
jgi:hypothetical protein